MIPAHYLRTRIRIAFNKIALASAACGALAAVARPAHAQEPPGPGSAEPAAPGPVAAGPGYGRRIPFGAYGEAFLIHEGDSTEANLERFVLFFGHSFTDWARLYSEVEIEDAKEVEVEQAYIELNPFRRIGLRAGLVLVPVGLVNLLHEPPTFNGVERPTVDQIIVPTTWREIGLGIFGELTEGLQYQLYVMNGLNAAGFSGATGIRGGRGEGSEARSRDPAVTARLDYGGILGFNVGASFYYGQADQGEAALDGVRVAIVEADARYARYGLRLRGEYARIFIRDAEKVTDFLRAADPSAEAVGSAQQGFYLEGGYDLFHLAGRSDQQLVPFVRYENANTHASLANVPNPGTSDAQQFVTAGLTYLPHPQIALKFDYRRRLEDPPQGEKNRYSFGIGFMF